MDTKMIVTDLDGTLLRDDKRISERTKNTLIRCRENGIKVVFASARGGSVERFAPDYLVDGKIRMNGAVAKIGDTNENDGVAKWLEENLIPIFA